MAKDLGLRWTDRRGYARNPDGRTLVEALDEACTRADGPAPGRIIAVEWWRDLPQHVGIVTAYREGGMGLIHTWATVGRVVEHCLTVDILERASGYWTWRN